MPRGRGRGRPRRNSEDLPDDEVLRAAEDDNPPPYEPPRPAPNPPPQPDPEPRRVADAAVLAANNAARDAVREVLPLAAANAARGRRPWGSARGQAPQLR